MELAYIPNLKFGFSGFEPRSGHHHPTRNDAMTPDAFNAWLADMKSAGLIAQKQDAAKALGVTDDTITKYSQRGGSLMLALACAALYHRIMPFGK